VKNAAGNHAWSTRDKLRGTGPTATLTKTGESYLRLIAGDF
jgi:hypothetical protein